MACDNVTEKTSSSSFVVPNLYAIKVSVDPQLSAELKLNGREKRGRVFIEEKSPGTRTLHGLKAQLHSFFRALKKNSYLLEASLPVISEQGEVIRRSVNSAQDDEASSIEDGNNDDVWWKIESDQNVIETFHAANTFFLENKNLSSILKRPSIMLHISKNPNAPPPPPEPHYLKDMKDPSQTESMTMLSFYSFPPSGVFDPDDFAVTLRKLWKPFFVLGRVYVAQEGINAQMSVPTNVLENFMACCQSIPELGTHMENGINIDPIPISVDDFPTAGVPLNGRPAPPFRNLHIRVRRQVVADGLDDEQQRDLDWQKAGYDMPPMEWHKTIEATLENNNDTSKNNESSPIILDCRNTYETNLGKFQGAEPLNTQHFRDSWQVLERRLADTPKDTPIMTYCTGGIRCVKVGAYLTQAMGFTNVSRLAGGIIAYDRTLGAAKSNMTSTSMESMFKGTNFVFDGRLGRAITQDDFGTCVTCGCDTSLVSNCLNDNCHKRIVQCQTCRTKYHGTCSDACKHRVLKGGLLQQDYEDDDDEDDPVEDESLDHEYTNLDDYSVGHSSPIPSLYEEMEENTKTLLASGAHMMSGPSQGRFLTQLASMTREGRILEVGTFTGYATACLLEGAAHAAKAIGNTKRSLVLSLERDSRALEIATAHLQIMQQFGIESEEGARAARALREENDVKNEQQNKVFESTFEGVPCHVVQTTDALATMEEMAQGKSDIQPDGPFDLVFLDADKTRLLDYVDALLEDENRLLKPGGMIVVDNVLWKGLVLSASRGDFSDDSFSSDEARQNRRARKLATKMHTFNSEIVKDPRVDITVLPLRDGLSILRKK